MDFDEVWGRMDRLCTRSEVTEFRKVRIGVKLHHVMLADNENVCPGISLCVKRLEKIYLKTFTKSKT